MSTVQPPPNDPNDPQPPGGGWGPGPGPGQQQWPVPPPQTPKRPWFKKKRFIIPVAFLLVIVVFQVANGGDSNSTQAGSSNTKAGVTGSSSPAVSGEPQADAGKAPSAKLGTLVRDGKFEFTASKLTCGVKSVGGQYLNEKAQGQFCILDLNVKNIGEEPQMFSESAQKAFSGATKYASSGGAAIVYATEKGLDSSNWLKEINPGNQMKAVVIFDIPAGKKLDKLELHDSVFSGGVEVAL